MNILVAEQETIINYARDGDECTVYTTDTTVMTRLDKLVEDPEAEWELVQIARDMANKSIVSKEYRTKKNLISFRAKRVSRDMTEEQRAEAAERLLESRRKKNAEV